MTFDAFESSLEGSRPIEIYTITIGSTIYRYSSSEDIITESADDFSPNAISRSRVTGGGPDSRKDNLTLTLPGDDDVVARYINSVPGIVATVVIERIQRSDGPTYQTIKIFEGRIESVAFEDSGRRASISVVPRVTAQSRTLPRMVYSGLCNHVLYDDLCSVDDTDPNYRLANGPVTVVDENTITVTGAGLQGDNYYTGGFVEADGGADHRLILDQTGDVLTLHLPFAVNPLGQLVNVFAGCDHTIATCKSKFDNVINFGGFAFVPTKNIFETGLST